MNLENNNINIYKYNSNWVFMDTKEFCKYCDSGHNGFDDCSIPEPRWRYSDRGWCGWSSIQGVKVETTGEHIMIDYTGELISRLETRRLQEAIEEGVKAGKNPFRTPEESPLQKALIV